MTDFQADHNHAIDMMFFSLVQHLHETGVMRGPVFLARLEARQAFGQAAFREEPNRVITALIAQLRELSQDWKPAPGRD